MTNGVFVDLGCYDGITYSNTWYMERVLNWSGICVEPNPAVYDRIASQAGRRTGVRRAVSDRKGTAPLVSAFMRSSLNASAVDYAFLQTQGVAAGTVEVELTTPGALLAEHLPSTVHAPRTLDYVNIDVEQLELPILRAWPWRRYCVTLINVENTPPAGTPSSLPQLRALLEPRGYEHARRIGGDEVFRRREPCGAAAASAGRGPAREARGGGGGRRRARRAAA